MTGFVPPELETRIGTEPINKIEGMFTANMQSVKEGSYNRWDVDLKNKQTTLAGEQVTLTQALLKRKRPLENPKTVKIGEQTFEVQREIVLEYTTQDGEHKRLVHQSLRTGNGLTDTGYRLSLVDVQEKEAGEQPVETESWGSVVGKRRLSDISADIDPKHAELASEMMKKVMEELSTNPEISSKEQNRKLRRAMKSHEEQGLPMGLDSKGRIQVAKEAGLQEEVKDLANDRLNSAVDKLRTMDDQPEARLHEVFTEYSGKDGFNDLIVEEKKDGETVDEKRARIEKGRSQKEKQEDVVDAVAPEGDTSPLRKITRALVTSFGLKTPTEALELAFPDTHKQAEETQ